MKMKDVENIYFQKSGLISVKFYSERNRLQFSTLLQVVEVAEAKK